MTASAPLRRAASTTWTMTGLPLTSSSSLFLGDMRKERPAARTMAATFKVLAISSAAIGLAALYSGDFRHYGEGDFGRALRADIEADWRFNALDVVLCHSRFPQALDAFRVRLSAP